MIATGCVAQHSGSSEATFVMGSGLDDQQGRCGFFWVKQLNGATGTASSALWRAEYRDGWAGNAFCNSGSINIRCGVVDFQGNLDTWGGEDYVPETADWQDFLNPLSSSMGYDFMTPTLQQEEVIAYTAPAGRSDEFGSSVLDGQFMEVDVTDQVNWILQNSGNFGIVCLVPPNEGNTGKVNTYTMEDGTGTMGLGSDSPWTTDGNSGHLKVISDDLVLGVEEDIVATKVSSHIELSNAPNPFTKTTTINYTTGKFGNGVLTIYSPTGQMVHSQHVSGTGNVSWNSQDLAMGIYMTRLTKVNSFLCFQRGKRPACAGLFFLGMKWIFQGLTI
jgi:hypothetical protein